MQRVQQTSRARYPERHERALLIDDHVFFSETRQLGTPGSFLAFLYEVNYPGRSMSWRHALLDILPAPQRPFRYFTLAGMYIFADF